MKIVDLAITVLIFSATVTLVNTLGLFDYNVAPIDVEMTQDQAQGVYRIGSTGSIDSTSSWYDQIGDGFEFIWKLMEFAGSALWMGLNIGGVFEKYVPGVVGESLSIFITGISYFFYAWGGFQIWRRFSSKGSD